MSATGKRDWLRAVRSDVFPRELRSIKATLLELAGVMDSAGIVATTRGKIADRTGLPPRTVDRHLSRAVAAGWLLHTRRACLGRLPQYTASVPDSECTPEVAHNRGRDARH